MTNNTICDVFTKWDKEKGWYVFLLILQVVILFANILLNGILCYLMKRLKKSNYRPCHILIWHLVIVNFLVAGFCQLTVVLKLLLPWSDQCWATLSQFSTVSFNVLRAVSAGSISLLSIDRYRSIVNHSTYKERTACSCIIFSITVVWIPSVVMGLSHLSITSANDSICIDTCLYSQAICSSTEHTVYNVLYIVMFFVLPTGVMVKTYYSVYSSARKHSFRRIDSRSNSRTGAGQTQTIPHFRVLSEVKAARVLLMALTAYMLCFTPYFASITLSVSEFWRDHEPPIGFLIFFHILLFSHTVFDPFVYGFGDRQVKKLWLEIFWKKKRSSDRVTRLPFDRPDDTLSIISLASVNTQPISPEGCTFVSREDLVSTEFLEIYRKRQSTGSMGMKVRPQRMSWVSARGKPITAWVGPSISHQTVCTRKTSQRTLKTLALRSIGEAAAALVLPQFTTSVTTDHEFTQLHRLTSRDSSHKDHDLTDVD